MSDSAMKPLLSEILRPKTLSDLVIDDRLRKRLDKCIQGNSVMNMTFYGSPGVGKTSAARILLSEIDADVLELNGSLSEGDKKIVRRIELFAGSCSLLHKKKVVFIEEADKLTKEVQEALRYVIENTSDNCRYILTVNDITKITDAIKSRCLPTCFDPPRDKINAILDEAIEVYRERLRSNDVNIDDYIIRDVIQTYFPDFRSIANHFQMEM
jgi:replication-associated recombination protein RarA